MTFIILSIETNRFDFNDISHLSEPYLDEKKQKSEKFDTYKANGKKPLWRSERTKAKQNNGKKNIK